jgi:hypothetical protein
MSATKPVSQAPSGQKASYRVTHWSAYDRALVAPGDITFWFDPEALQGSWLAAPTGNRGAPVLYSEWSIQTLVVLKQVFL